MIGPHVPRHEEELRHIIIEKNIIGKRDWKWPRTSYIKNMISDTGLINYK